MPTAYKLPSEYQTTSFRHASTKERLALLEAQEDAYVARQMDLAFLAGLEADLLSAYRHLQEEANA